MGNELLGIQKESGFTQAGAKDRLQILLNTNGVEVISLECEGLYIDLLGLQYYAFVATDKYRNRQGFLVTDKIITGSDILEYRDVLSAAARIG